jgi:hypothetical protein
VPPRKRSHSVSVLLTDEEFERLEAFCVEHGHKKSTLIAKLIREHLDAVQVQRTLGFPRTREDS